VGSFVTASSLKMENGMSDMSRDTQFRVKHGRFVGVGGDARSPVPFLAWFFFFFAAGLCADSTGGAEGMIEAKATTQAWKAGVARVMITPEESMWMAGYAARDRPSEGTLQDLWAKALALEDGRGHRAVLVTTDLIGFRGSDMSDRIRDRLREDRGLSEDQLVLSSSHTHTGPELLRQPEDYWGLESESGQHSPEERDKVRRYSEKLEDQIVALVQQALDGLQPVQLFSGQGVARFAVNRRNNREAQLDPHTPLVGPVDHSVPVIKVTQPSGALLAVVFGYACHTTTLSIYQFSGDYAGFAQTELEEAFPGAAAMFFAGCGGDQNPLPRRTVGYARQYGKTLAAAVEAIITEPMRELSPQLTTAYSKVELGFANPPPTKDELSRIMEPDSGYPGYLKDRAKVLLTQLERGMSLVTCYSYPVQFWRIGDQDMVILAGEVVVDYSLELKRLLGKDLFVMAYANEGMGYIPSARVLDEGGYEGSRSALFTTPWAADIEEKIVSEVVRLAEEVANKKTNR
jgi:neutral ceramidase